MAKESMLRLQVSLGDSQKRDFFSVMYEQYCTGSLCDYTIKTSREEIRCHRLVLVAFYPYFKDMAESKCRQGITDSQTTDLSDLNNGAVKQLVEYAYGVAIDFSADTVEHLVIAADYLNADAIKAECDKFLAETVNSSNCMKYYVIGKLYRLQSVAIKSRKLVLRHFENLFKSDEFTALHPQCLKQFLQDDALNVSCEEIVIEAIMTWIKHDVSSRRTFSDELFKAVRWSYCSQGLLATLTEDRKYKAIVSSQVLNKIQSVLQERFGPVRRTRRRKNAAKIDIQQQARYSLTNNRLMIIGGKSPSEYLWDDEESSCVLDCMCWNRTEETWSKFTELPQHYLNVAKWEICATDGRIFVSGGISNDVLQDVEHAIATVWMWHNNTWTALPPMKQGRCEHGMVYANNKLFCFGGKFLNKILNNNSQRLNSIEFLDLQQPATSWTRTTRMKKKFSSPLISVLGDNIYILGMFGAGSKFIRDTFVYSISHQKLTAAAPMPNDLYNGKAITVGQEIFVFSMQQRESCMSYTPATDTWCHFSQTWDLSKDMPEFESNINLLSLSFFDGRIVRAESQQSVGRIIRGGSHCVKQSVDEYDLEHKEWSKSDMTLPGCYANKKVMIVNAHIDI